MLSAGRSALRRSIRYATELGRGRGLPKSNLLIYLARPNSDAYITAEDAEISESQADWGYVLPSALFADLGEGLFFDALGEPIVVLASEILAHVSTNKNYILFKLASESEQTGKLAIYDPATTNAALIRAWKVLRNHTVLDSNTVLDSTTILG